MRKVFEVLILGQRTSAENKIAPLWLPAGTYVLRDMMERLANPDAGKNNIVIKNGRECTKKRVNVLFCQERTSCFQHQISRIVRRKSATRAAVVLRTKDGVGFVPALFFITFGGFNALNSGV